VTDSVIPNEEEENREENNAAGQNNDAQPSQASGNAVTNALWGTAQAARTFAQQHPRTAIIGGVALGSNS